MNSLGIKLLAFLYVGAGGAIGEFIHELFHGRAHELFHERQGFLAATAIFNIVGIACLVLLGRRFASEPPIQRVSVSGMLLRGLPVTNRVAFMLFSVAWVIGVVFGLVATL